MVADEQWSEVERRLVEAACRGESVDLRTGDPALDDPAQGAGWAGSRAVRAELVAQLVAGAKKPTKGQLRAVRLSGARLTGALDLEAAVLVCPLVLESCHFDEPINLNDAQAVVIRLPGCHIPGITADNLHVRGNLELDRVVTKMTEVFLIGAHIGGQLIFSGANLTNPGGTAVNGDGLTVNGGMFCRGGFIVQGAVRLIGAHISGQLDFNGAKLTNPDGTALCGDGLTVNGDMYCEDGFTSQGEVSLAGAHITGGLSFNGAKLTNPDATALHGDALTIGRRMYCEDGFTAQGEVRLGGAHVGGQLRFSGASLTNPGGTALDGDNLVVDQDMFCRDGFTAQGEVSLMGAHITGHLGFDGANVTNTDGTALNGGGLTVGRRMFCEGGFAAQGEVSLVGAHITGQLSFDGANLTNPDGTALCGDNLTVNGDMYCGDGFISLGEVSLAGAHITGDLGFRGASLTKPDGDALGLQGANAGALWLLPRRSPEGVVDLTNARVGSFVDDPVSWPVAMWLRGFVYEVLENDSVSVRARLRWLARHQGGYAPGLFDQLAATYRRTGHVEAARRVAIAKQRHRRGELNPLGWLWNWFLYLTVGYGYRPWLAGLWLAALLAVGAAVFTGAHPNQIHAVSATAAPEFQPVVYTLDVMLPIVNFGQETAWVPQDAARMWAWALTGAGWVLTTAFLAGLTNALKRD